MFFAMQKNTPLFTSADAGVIAFCEGFSGKINLLLKERKLSTVNQGSM
jgi:hypothetical protein